MFYRRIVGLILFSLSAFSVEPTVTADEAPSRAKLADDKPFTVAVVDKESGKPITTFHYIANCMAPGRALHTTNEWHRVESASGTFVLQAPVTCLINVRIESIDYLSLGYPYQRRFEVRPNDTVRRGVVELERGITAHGTIRDAGTNRPIAGATVIPRILYGVHGEHAPSGPLKRQAKTDNNGHYELRGVDPALGVVVYHPDDQRSIFGVQITKGEGTQFDAELVPFEKGTLHGIVRDTTGQPLEGVTVHCNQNQVQTARDGVYSLDCVLGRRGEHGTPVLWYIKKGFISRHVDRHEVAKATEVVLERQISLDGQVFGPDGQPVKRFAVCALSRFGEAGNVDGHTVEQSVVDADGRFKLWLDYAGATRVCVRAEGYEDADTTADVARRGGSVAVRLASGVRIEGKIVAPPVALSKIEARLVPRRHRYDDFDFVSNSDEMKWLMRTASLATDGTLRFDHVRPDRYILLLRGPGVTSRLLAVDVPAGGLNLGQIRLAGTGRIQGHLFGSAVPLLGKPAFAFGEIAFYPAVSARMMDFQEKIEFITDFEGRFSIADVPVGLVNVAFPVTVGHVTDIDGPWVRVCENQTTEVRFPGPKGTRPLHVEVVIGDGSLAQSRSGKGLSDKIENNDVKPPAPKSAPLGADNELDFERTAPVVELDFGVELMPGPDQPLSSVRSEAGTIDGKREFVLFDVSPGKYRLRVERGTRNLLSFYPTDVVFERDITLTAHASAIKVPLGGGSITGRASKRSDVIAIPKGKPGPLHRTGCDTDGYFCMPFLNPGTYTLFTHSPGNGLWCRADNVRVASDVKDIGELRPARGGSIHGSISFQRPCAVPVEVIATGPSQVSLEPIKNLRGFDQFELGGLWPGRWTITVRGDGETLATATTAIKGTELVTLELAAEPHKQQ